MIMKLEKGKKGFDQSLHVNTQRLGVRTQCNAIQCMRLVVAYLRHDTIFLGRHIPMSLTLE
jgi:hypothetical protein